jgi:hypothetical protein
MVDYPIRAHERLGEHDRDAISLRGWRHLKGGQRLTAMAVLVS